MFFNLVLYSWSIWRIAHSCRWPNFEVHSSESPQNQLGYPNTGYLGSGSDLIYARDITNCDLRGRRATDDGLFCNGIVRRALLKRALTPQELENKIQFLKSERFENERILKTAEKTRRKLKPGVSPSASLQAKPLWFVKAVRVSTPQGIKSVEGEKDRYLQEAQGLRETDRSKEADRYEQAINSWWASFTKKTDALEAFRAEPRSKGVLKASSSGAGSTHGLSRRGLFKRALSNEGAEEKSKLYTRQPKRKFGSQRRSSGQILNPHILFKRSPFSREDLTLRMAQLEKECYDNENVILAAKAGQAAIEREDEHGTALPGGYNGYILLIYLALNPARADTLEEMEENKTKYLAEAKQLKQKDALEYRKQIYRWRTSVEQAKKALDIVSAAFFMSGPHFRDHILEAGAQKIKSSYGHRFREIGGKFVGGEQGTSSGAQGAVHDQSISGSIEAFQKGLGHKGDMHGLMKLIDKEFSSNPRQPGYSSHKHTDVEEQGTSITKAPESPVSQFSRLNLGSDNPQKSGNKAQSSGTKKTRGKKKSGRRSRKS